MSQILLKNISKSFDDKQVLLNFNASFSYGSRTCIMAPSGEGKTTLLNLILGLLKPDKGEIIGVPNQITAVFQEDRLCQSFTAVGNIMAVTGKKKSLSEIQKCLEELGLKDSMNKKVSLLSGGMKRRVAIARALMAESQMIIFDEPFKGLDEATHAQTAEVILKYTQGKTLIISTHDPNDAQLLNAEIFNM